VDCWTATGGSEFPENSLEVHFLLAEINLIKPIKIMNRKEAQARISSGLPVYAYIRDGQQRHQIKSIGLTICHSTTNQRFTNNSVEFTAS
jgi:hypothetical protein